MTSAAFSIERFQAAPIVGIVRNLLPATVKKLLPLYVQSGLTTLEITMNTPGAGDMIRDALEHHVDTLNIGAGTVCTLTDLDNALAAGAQFIVTPIIKPAVIQACVERGIPVFPGAFTPSEIYQAWELGATMVKVYPAASLAPDFLRHIKAPLNDIKLLPTGGITLENITAFREAGADGVGVGSPLFVQKLINEQNWPALVAHFRGFASKWAS